jgi:hypothetical protein
VSAAFGSLDLRDRNAFVMVEFGVIVAGKILAILANDIRHYKRLLDRPLNLVVHFQLAGSMDLETPTLGHLNR